MRASASFARRLHRSRGGSRDVLSFVSSRVSSVRGDRSASQSSSTKDTDDPRSTPLTAVTGVTAGPGAPSESAVYPDMVRLSAPSFATSHMGLRSVTDAENLVLGNARRPRPRVRVSVPVPGSDGDGSHLHRAAHARDVNHGEIAKRFVELREDGERVAVRGVDDGGVTRSRGRGDEARALAGQSRPRGGRPARPSVRDRATGRRRPGSGKPVPGDRIALEGARRRRRGRGRGTIDRRRSRRRDRGPSASVASRAPPRGHRRHRPRRPGHPLPAAAAAAAAATTISAVPISPGTCTLKPSTSCG